MGMIDLGSPAAKVHSSLENLQEAWMAAQEKWNDDNARKFEEEYLMPLALTVKLSLDAVNRMAETLHEAERDCQESREVF